MRGAVVGGINDDAPQFHPTRWSLVARAGSTDDISARQALGELCETYWLPLYAYARRIGLSDADAADHVQAFCADLLADGGLGGADPARGRFRHYLLAAFRHHVANGRRAEAADRRGGNVFHWSLQDATTRCAADLVGHDTPERTYERRFALELLARATWRLTREHRGSRQMERYEALSPVLLGAADAPDTHELAQRLGLNEGAVRVALHRLRGRLRELIRDEVLQTLADPTDLEDELRYLKAALAR